MPYAAIVLAGGAGRRMGGPTKPLLEVGGVSMLHRVVAAVDGADPIVVVGPPELRDALPQRARLTREQPPGAGPVAAIAAGLDQCPDAGLIAVVAADLPFLTADALDELAAALAEGGDVALYLDRQGFRQSLCGVWRANGLRAAVDEYAAGLSPVGSGDGAGSVPAKGVSMRSLLAAADVVEVPWSGALAPPWFDCDTPDDLAKAEAM